MPVDHLVVVRAEIATGLVRRLLARQENPFPFGRVYARSRDCASGLLCHGTEVSGATTVVGRRVGRAASRLRGTERWLVSEIAIIGFGEAGEIFPPDLATSQR